MHRYQIHAALLVAGVSLGLGCSQVDTPDTRTLGTLSLPLATEVNGVRYRLNGDSFYVAGPVSRDLEPNGSGIIVYATLPAGAYEVGLRDRWQLSRQVGDGFEPVDAELISENPRSVEIQSGTTTILAWVFQTDGVPVGLEPPGIVQGNLSVLDTSNPTDTLAGDLLLGAQTNVDALSGVEVIGGHLGIGGNGVESLAALGALARVEGDLSLEASALSSLDGLEQLTYIGGSLRLTGNGALTSLQALGALRSVGAIVITDNSALPSCEAEWLVDNITGLGGSIGHELPDGGLQPGPVTLSGNDESGSCP